MICLFGGTFDPVHIGHLHAARVVCDALSLENLRMLLSARPVHRDVPGASVEQRWRMLELACADDPRLLPDATEVRRAARTGRPSYAVETLEALRADAPDAVLCWVVGSDGYREIATWHRWRELFEFSNVVVLRRPGDPLELDAELAALTERRRLVGTPGQPAGGVLVLDAAMKDVSATRVRKALADPANRDTAADLLPPAVYTYIKEYHLYGVLGDA